jgi:hypothetical protein
MVMKVKGIKKRVENQSNLPAKVEEQEKPVTMQEVLDSLLNNMNQAANSTSLLRDRVLSKLIDPRRDIDDECGYPKELDPEQYRLMYDREGIATKVVKIYPQESWSDDPTVEENDKPKDTPFEEAWKELEMQHQLYSVMENADELSGVGRFGVILLGIGDGLDLNNPVDGVDEMGKEKTGGGENELLYTRVFDEQFVTVSETEGDIHSPRYGLPTMYSIKFETLSNVRDPNSGQTKGDTAQETKVHWTRIIHIADNRESSEVYGVPRMQTLFNRLYDIRKISGGSGEMFWKGGFPEYIFNMDPSAKNLTDAQKQDFKDQIADFANGLQRYLRLQNIEAQNLEVQLADPKNHVDIQLTIIAISLGIPKRIFMGSEQAKLASSQDSEHWNKRIARRQQKYVSPYIIRPTIDRLIAFGVLPEPKEMYKIVWPDLEAPSEKDKAEVLKAQMEAFSKYVAGNVDELIPPEIFFTMFVDLTPDQVKEIMAAAEKRQEDLEVDEEELEQDQPVPPEEPEEETEEE